MAGTYHAEAGWSIERARSVERRAGLLESFRDSEEATVSTVERVLAAHRECVFSLGAAHSHYQTPALFARVVLLLPAPDPVRSVAVLRERCRALGLREWRDAGCDMIERWVTDGCNAELATLTVYPDGKRPEQTRDEILAGLVS